MPSTEMIESQLTQDSTNKLDKSIQFDLHKTFYIKLMKNRHHNKQLIQVIQGYFHIKN